MTSKRKQASSAMTAVLAAQLCAVVASAAPPANLGGTTWTVQTNRDAAQLVITNQGGAGAPGAETCRLIIGEIGIAPIRGWYCPPTGRIHFLHKNMSTGATVRVFTGNLSDDGDPLHMGGTMTVLTAAFGALGEYNFSATQ